MSHANAALTPRHRLKVTQLVVDEYWPTSRVSLPPRSIGYVVVSTLTGCHTQIGRQVNRSEGTNMTILDQC